MKRDLVDVISRYVEVDRDKIDVHFEQENNGLAMLANIPITGVNRNNGDGSGGAKEDDAETAAAAADTRNDAAAPTAPRRRKRRKGGQGGQHNGAPAPAT
jgi:hypothetical protein